MGSTIACAQCHTHKYDPIAQEEYFKVFAILNETEDADRTDVTPVHALFTEADIQTLAAQQKLFLTNAARVLKPGGQLVYSTCSVETDENERVIREFVQDNPCFSVAKTARTWPHREGADGFFFASLRLAGQQ